MLRHRRRTTQQPQQTIDEWEELSNLREKFKRNLQQKELKIEMQRMQMENKLNHQIRRYIDKQLNQLNDKKESAK